MTDYPDYVEKNRRHWNKNADWWVPLGEKAWASEPSWGMWGIPESELQLLPLDMTGLRAIDLGCGTGYFSGWMERRGASVTAIDVSERQLDTARRLAGEHGAGIEFIQANAESVPLPDNSFDFALSEYGAAIWADPYEWIPEAARLLRPGGELIFLGNGVLQSLTVPLDVEEPAGRTLLRSYFDLHRLDWTVEDGDEGTEFALPIGGWFVLLKENGFEVIDFIELRSPAPGDEVRFTTSAAWAHDFPSEQVWRVRKRPESP